MKIFDIGIFLLPWQLGEQMIFFLRYFIEKSQFCEVINIFLKFYISVKTMGQLKMKIKEGIRNH